MPTLVLEDEFDLLDELTNFKRLVVEDDFLLRIELGHVLYVFNHLKNELKTDIDVVY